MRLAGLHGGLGYSWKFMTIREIRADSIGEN